MDNITMKIFDNIFGSRVFHMILCSAIYFSIETPYFLLNIILSVIAFTMIFMAFIRWIWELFNEFEVAFLEKYIQILKDIIK